jgi:hypothetical protein
VSVLTTVAAAVLLVVILPSGSPLNPRSSKLVPTDSTLTQPTLTRAFLRSGAGGIAIRAFNASGETLRSTANGSPPVLENLSSDSLEADISTGTGAVDTTTILPPPPLSSGEAESPVSAVSFGDAGSTADVVVVYSSDNVSTVNLTGVNGETDQMTPVNGWSVLGISNSDQGAEIEAINGTGSVLQTQTITFQANPTPGSPPWFVRTTTDGILVRGAESDGFVIAQISSSGMAVSLEGIPVCPVQAPDGLYVVPQDSVGAAAGSPTTVIPVQVGSGASLVEAQFSDGVSDKMTPVNGLAILAHQGSVSATVMAMSSDGSVIASESVPANSSSSIVPCPS